MAADYAHHAIRLESPWSSLQPFPAVSANPIPAKSNACPHRKIRETHLSGANPRRRANILGFVVPPAWGSRHGGPTRSATCCRARHQCFLCLKASNGLGHRLISALPASPTLSTSHNKRSGRGHRLPPNSATAFPRPRPGSTPLHHHVALPTIGRPSRRDATAAPVHRPNMSVLSRGAFAISGFCCGADQRYGSPCRCDRRMTAITFDCPASKKRQHSASI